ncbi:MAG: flagellar hook-basal body complex protein [Lachnospiraceae bacterium]|nr:flagellar hook-basal body complex protein [Lachnospiraceae bacterium]
MMRSLFSGVAGLKTHQTKMDVIGNNIANVNTVAYKSQSITFSELMYQTTQSASGPNATTGTAGTNAKQIGLGVQSAAISTAITQQGSTQNTGNAFDLRITGDSFFVVSNGSSNYFTRDGSFYVDAVGNLAMSSNGYNVMGWQVNDKGEIVQDNVSKLQIMSAKNLTSDPVATTLATMNGIVDKNDPQIKSEEGKVINLSFYDNMGYPYTARFKMNGTDDLGKYVLKLENVLDSNNESILDKFDASIFTTELSNTYASREKAYGLNEKYTNTAGTLALASGEDIEYEYKDANGNTVAATASNLNPADCFAGYNVKTGELEGADEQQIALANLYAKAYGFSGDEAYKEFLSKTVQDTDAEGNVTEVAVGTLLSQGNVATDNGTELFADDGTLLVTGYVLPEGEGISVLYNQETGSLQTINGMNITSFNLNLAPKTSTADNPFEQISVDIKDTKNLNNDQVSTVGATSGDKEGNGTGCALGTMTGVSIQRNGMIYGAYDNGQTKLLGQIAVANFSNAAGLEKEGDNLYSATLNSGEFDGIGVDITAGGGSMQTGVLEMSNVDLSSEFTELITTQRGFQANSRIITVSDTLLEELVNLKR